MSRDSDKRGEILFFYFERSISTFCIYYITHKNVKVRILTTNHYCNFINELYPLRPILIINLNYKKLSSKKILCFY